MTSNSNKPKIMVENISCILPQQSGLGGLFLGNVYGAQNAAILKEYGIRAVLTTSIQTDIEYSFRDVPFHMRILAHDKQDYNMKQHINQCIQFIEQSRQLTNVYVHCFAGVSRSAAIICAYIMWKLKWNFQTTMAFVKAKRIVAKPNQGFMKQLMELEVMLQGNQDGFDGNYGGFIVDKSLQSVYSLPPKNEIMQQKEESIRNSLKPTVTNTINGSSQTYPTNKNNKMSLSTQYLQRSQTQNSSQKNKVQSQYYVPVPSKNPKTQTDDLCYAEHEKIRTKNSVQKKDSVKTAATTTVDNKFTYLQNFFPQSNPVKNQTEKQKSMISSMKTGGADTGVDKLQSARNSLKGMDNGNFIPQNSTQKHTSNYHLPIKPSQKSLAQNNIILGGRKSQQLQMSQSINYHNSIPIPNIKQQSTSSSANKTYFIKNDSTKPNNSKPNQQPPYHPLKSGYNNRASMDSPRENSRLKVDQGRNQINGVISPRGQQKPSSYFRFDQYAGMKSPNASGNNFSHLSGQRFDMTNSVHTSQSFFSTKLSVQKNDAKTSSRLVKPKDLPGYKNY